MTEQKQAEWKNNTEWKTKIWINKKAECTKTLNDQKRWMIKNNWIHKTTERTQNMHE